MQKTAMDSYFVHARSCDQLFKRWKLPAQMMRVMRMLTFLLIAASLSAAASGTAQSITISGKALTYLQIFTAIEKQSGYVVMYDPDLVPDKRTFSLSIDNRPLTQVLNIIFKDQPLKYVIEDKTVFLSRKLPEASSDRLELIYFLPITGFIHGDDGKALVGATVRVKGKTASTVTDNEGRFALSAEVGDILVITYVGFVSKEYKVKDANAMELKLERKEADLGDVEVVINTGYQKLKPNEMAGAVDIITKKMLMEQTGTTVMERLVGMSGSLNFNNKVLPGNATGNPNSVLNMTIRGYSTISGTTDPLIIVNNFPYTGDIDNIDPNDVENIVILKDAAATAMWGIRAANGVIVITTSGSKFNQKTRINFRSTTSITEKPNLNKVDVATGPEVYDFITEFRGKSLDNSLFFFFPVPYLDYLGWQYYNKGSISKEEFDTKLDVMKALNPKKQWSDLLYRNGNAQTYSLNISGGSENLAWTIAGNFEQGIEVLQAKSRRSNIRMNTNYKLNEKLSLELGVAFTNSFKKTGAPAYNSLRGGQGYMVTSPLVNADGTPYGDWINFSPIYMDTVGEGLYGDLKFYPVNNWKHDYTRTDLTSYVKNFGIKYSPFKNLDISGTIQSINQSAVANNILDNDSYYTRFNRANASQINRTTKIITYHIPVGEFRKIRNNYANSFNARFDINYRKTIKKGVLLFNGAFDIAESKNFSDGQFLGGYKDNPRSYIYMPKLLVNSSLSGGLATIVGVDELTKVTDITQRNISTTASFSYVYDDRIIFNANARRDGANILGVSVNERWKPNYSLALNWNIHKEKFFRIPFVSNLTTGISFGYLGNVDVSKSSRIIVYGLNYSVSTDLGEYHNVDIPPNPELRWEKTAHTNFKLDVGLFKDRLQIRTNYFVKSVRDLYMNTAVDPFQTLAGSYVANAGSMKVKGYEINIQAKIVQSTINYDITLTTANTKEKVEYYPNSRTNSGNLLVALANDGVDLGTTPALFANMPLYSIFSLNGTQGVNNIGNYFLDYRGVRYTSYSDLFTGLNTLGKDMEGVKYYGTGTPKFTGSIHNRINYKRFFLVFSIQAELGHYFKYPKDQLANLSLSSQFYKSWKKAGDEGYTNIPSYSYPEAASWGIYGSYANVNIFKAGVIRLNNIQLNYDIPTKKLRTLNVALNIQNLGKIWTANKEGYDYRYLNYMTYNGQDKYYAFTLNIGL